ncbi:MAG: aldo/keto reductase [Nitrospira sp.]|nr:aldo/keto reductase [Nitrospira sp.]
MPRSERRPDALAGSRQIWGWNLALHPSEFLADQLTLSLDRLGLTTLDVCLLHNPEYYFSEAIHRGDTDQEKLRTEFYARLERAFRYFETQVREGRLRYYGVSSNTAASPSGDPEATSLDRMIQAAQSAAESVGSARHHFQVLQYPMDLFESRAALTANTGPSHSQTVLEYATHNHIAVLVNRPLNAMVGQNRMLRLADLPLDEEPIDFNRHLGELGALEQDYRSSIAPHIEGIGTDLTPTDFFKWSIELQRVRPQIQGLEHWEQIEHRMIAPQVNQVFQRLERSLSGDVAERWTAWRQRYVPIFLTLLRGLRHEATARSRAQADRVTETIDPFLPAPRLASSLSQKALWVLSSTPGVTCVLNGMRTTRYVEDSLSILKWEPLKETTPIYEGMTKLTF